MAPAPRTRVPKGAVITDPTKPSEQQLDSETTANTEQNAANGHRKSSITDMPSSPKAATAAAYLMRRRSSGHNGSMDRATLALPLRSDDPEVLQHLKHLGPSNAANRPKQTRINTVKIKPGIPVTIPENGAVVTPSHAPQGGIGEGLLENAGREASDGVHSLVVGYGTISQTADRMSWKSGKSGKSGLKPAEEEPASPKSAAADESTALIIDNKYDDSTSKQRSRSVSTIASLHSVRLRSKSPPKKRHTARSGSISENIVDVNGVKKIILETTSSSDSDQRLQRAQADSAQPATSETDGKSAENTDNGGRKKRKKRSKKKKAAGESSESQPLLGGERS